MNQKQMMEIALAQSAADLGCDPSDFLKSENIVIPSARTAGARAYLKQPNPCHIVSYGNGAAAAADAAICGEIQGFLNRIHPVTRCFCTPYLTELDAILSQHGCKTGYLSEYWLPDLSRLHALPCSYSLRVLHHDDFAELYLPEWSNALCADRAELDVLGIGAYDADGKLIGLAGCSADCELMWQIGIDVLPSYRQKGVAAALTSRLALEILSRDRVPFYCCAWSNLPSAKNAVRSGFTPAWVELDARRIESSCGNNG